MTARRLLSICLLGLAVIWPACPAVAAPVELAATPSNPAPDEDGAKPDKTTAGQRWRSAKSVKIIQQALADLGLYIGPVDGHLDEETRGAIRVYQSGAGLKADGKVSRDLLNLLQNAVEVRALLQRLDRVRRSGKDAARQALLSHPSTRDLIQDQNAERADPTRDKEACFRDVTVRCLLDEASESVKAVFRPELRDWALGEILVSQARAGLTEDAMLTARRIRDPRLIMVALRDIAEAQAAAGMSAEAQEAARIIPDIDKRIEALAAIARIQTHRREAVAAMIALLSQVDKTLKRISFRTRAAVILAQAGDLDGATREMAAAEGEARAHADAGEKGMALLYVASALADMELPGQALNLLDDISSTSERTSVLVSAANAQARAGDADGAEATLQVALAAVDNIKVPFARSFAISRIAPEMVRLVRADAPTDAGTNADGSLAPLTYRKAVEMAGRIDDNRLRAQTLWEIAAARRRAGDVPGAVDTEAKAEAATGEIISKLSRVWMFGEMAENYARRGEHNLSWATFQRGVKAARVIDNPWGRSRAMARMATPLIEVVDPKVSRLDVEEN
ncbi:MAG: peptidoglycan-binding domain-containing protein [Rhodospirillaceae bacterium]